MLRVLLACVLLAIGSAPAFAQEPTANDLADELHPEHLHVVLNGVQVSDDTPVYLANDETVYVSENDLIAWKLKLPQKSSFERDGRAFYGLQTDAHLATSFDRAQNELEVVAPSTAFVGQRSAGPINLTAGRGAFLNYNQMRENGTYDLYLADKNGVFKTRYLSTAGSAGLEFHRGETAWYRLDPVHHYVLLIGEGTSGDDWLSTSAGFAGVHFASEYTSDPSYLGHAPLSVSGVAETPSFLEVFIDNISIYRADVPQGPFTVRDLPPSAARSDVVMVLTDAQGKKKIEIARPAVDAQLVAKGKTWFAFDAGIGEENRNLKNTYYRHGIFAGAIRHGISNRVTGEIFAESINGENFIDAGPDVRLGPDQTFEFRIGGGNKRHSGQYRLNLTRGKFRFNERFSYSSLKQEPIEGLDLGDVARLSETSELSVDFSPKISLGLSLNRSRDNQGSDASLLSMRTSFRSDSGVTLNLNPFYDFPRHLMSANMSISFSVGSNRRINERSAITTQNEISSALEYRKDSSDPNDPISYEAQISANQSQDRSISISDQLPWASTNFRAQEQNHVRVYEPDISGAVAFVGGNVYALRSINSSESFGVVHIPGLKNVRVSVNSEPVGRTDSHGDLLLKKLSPYRDNTITVSEEDIPLSVNIRDPQKVVPASASPANVTIPILSRGGLIIEVVDERGTPLAPGSELSSASGATYVVGYGGRAYITGVKPGPQQLTGSVGAKSCKVDIDVPSNVDDIPDLGRLVCRAQR
ncbi:MAG: fimbrial biogenesis outer membrane usher protein [Candidatus Eremiobacteraeota bacterium]|nr:fimbrial biogenesis outer membrane usher protein [Candidatus Eremiobacteraeota bacterium]